MLIKTAVLSSIRIKWRVEGISALTHGDGNYGTLILRHNLHLKGCIIKVIILQNIELCCLPYKCLTHEQTEKQMYLTDPPDVVAISWYQHIAKHAGKYSLVLYRFTEKEENLPPEENPSICPSIRKVGEQLDAGKVPKSDVWSNKKTWGSIWNKKMLVRFQRCIMFMSSTDRKIRKTMTA